MLIRDIDTLRSMVSAFSLEEQVYIIEDQCFIKKLEIFALLSGCLQGDIKQFDQEIRVVHSIEMKKVQLQGTYRRAVMYYNAYVRYRDLAWEALEEGLASRFIIIYIESFLSYMEQADWHLDRCRKHLTRL